MIGVVLSNTNNHATNPLFKGLSSIDRHRIDSSRASQIDLNSWIACGITAVELKIGGLGIGIAIKEVAKAALLVEAIGGDTGIFWNKKKKQLEWLHVIW